MLATADQAELAEILRLASRAADAWKRGEDEGDRRTQDDASKMLDVARYRLRRLSGRAGRAA
jgi:hypothetical protein